MHILNHTPQIALANGGDASNPDLPPASLINANTTSNGNGTIDMTNRSTGISFK